MRVHIISDMEGVAGITNSGQTNAGEPLYEEGRRLYTEEINAAIRGAFAGGATDVVVMDHHGAGGDHSFNSLVPDLLDPRCEFVVQTEWTQYTGFLEEGVDACLLVGMHARAGVRDGVLNHTVSGQAWQNLWFNDVLVGETGINAALCGTFGCPVVLVTGDRATCAEAEELLPGVTTVQVKIGIARRAARHVPPVRARELIEAGAKAALADVSAVAAYEPGRPAEIKVEYKNTAEVDKVRDRRGVEVLDDRTIVVRGDDWWSAWRGFFF